LDQAARRKTNNRDRSDFMKIKQLDPSRLLAFGYSVSICSELSREENLEYIWVVDSVGRLAKPDMR
jgi:hypothetical protein